MMRVSHSVFPLLLCTVIILAACTPESDPGPSAAKSDPTFGIDRIISSAEPIVPDQPPPDFTQHFDEGTTVIYSYVFLRNTETMTGSFPVRLRWFYPNDFRPPMAQHTIELQPGQNIAQFSLHNEDGLQKGPYLLIARTGKDEASLTASGSARVYIGMSPEEVNVFLDEEEAYRRQKDEERAQKEMEQAEGGEGTEGREPPSSAEADFGGPGGIEEVKEAEESEEAEEEVAEALPPALVGGEE